MQFVRRGCLSGRQEMSRLTRPGAAGDVDAMVAIHGRCFADTYATQLSIGSLRAPSDAAMLDQFSAWMAPGSQVTTHVVVDDGSAVAYCAVAGNQVLHLFVDPSHQGTGLGGRLLEQAEALIAANGHGDLELHTRVDNENAVSFYRGAGWTVTDQVITTEDVDITYDEHVLVKSTLS